MTSPVCSIHLDVRNAHHSASHRDKTEDYHRVTQYYVSQFAYLVSRLDQMREGDRSVLDNSCLLFINNMFSGSRHDSTKVPLLMAGGLGGTIDTGRVLDYSGKSDDDRKLCSLYLSLIQRMGLAAGTFGDAEKPLAGV